MIVFVKDLKLSHYELQFAKGNRIVDNHTFFCDILDNMDFGAVAKFVLDKFSAKGVRCAIIAHRQYVLKMLERAKIYEMLPGYQVKVVVPEDIIGLKLQRWRMTLRDHRRIWQIFNGLLEIIKHL